ncbi:MAG TPA: hypothetical protein VHB20_14550 [Verrucomicrobiae bacterium]|jgi:hypothetical protein|nr:hypothetical protein [Verrucomicrobiae bacterium]
MNIQCNLKSSSSMCALAQWCATEIAAAKTRQHLWLLGQAGLGAGSLYQGLVIDENYRDIQAFIRGVRGPDRRVFILHVKHYLAELWQGKEARGRDYVAAVRAVQESQRRAA